MRLPNYKLHLIIKYVVLVICPIYELLQAIIVKHKSKKCFNWLQEWLSQDENAYVFNLLNNMGFMTHSISRAFVAQTKLPVEVYGVLSGEPTEDTDVIAIIEHIMHEKMSGVFNQLVNNNLLDIITMHHLYVGDGIVITTMSNVYEADYQEQLQSITFKVAIALSIAYAIAIALLLTFIV